MNLKLSVREKILVFIIVTAIKNGKFLWLATQAALWIKCHLVIDKDTKTWKITSDPAFDPSSQVRNYDDIAAIFKSHPENFKVTEERTADGKFKSFSVET